jgi:hypothetical protein
MGRPAARLRLRRARAGDSRQGNDHKPFVRHPHLHAKLLDHSLTAERPRPRGSRLAAAPRVLRWRRRWATRVGRKENGAGEAARFKGQGGPDARAQGGGGRARVTGAETGEARLGPTRARPEEEDDRRVPTCRRDKEEGGDAGCSGPLVGCEAETASWATGK